jgi:phosphohistidine phosphatase
MSPLGVYLVRHEEAEESANDAERALTGLGRQRMRRTGERVAKEARIDCLYSSPLVRAVQTAEILAGALSLDEPVWIRPEIASPPSLRSLARLIEEVPASYSGVAIVGHEPTLGALAANLLRVQLNRGVQKGAVIALESDRKGTFRFQWMLIPDQAERIERL